MIEKTRILEKPKAQQIHTTPSKRKDSTDLVWFETTKQTTRRILRFCDDFGGFQAVGEGIYLDGNEQAHRAESTKSAQKLNPKEKR